MTRRVDTSKITRSKLIVDHSTLSEKSVKDASSNLFMPNSVVAKGDGRSWNSRAVYEIRWQRARLYRELAQ